MELEQQEEIVKIEKAQVISQKAFEQALTTLKVGQTESEIADTLAKIIKSLGAQGLAFEPIIASGPNSGLPHHFTGDRRLSLNDILLFDFGAKYQNYCADLSRTVFFGKAPDLRKNIFNHVLTAQKKALAAVKQGIKQHEPFHAANNHFKENKLEKYFLHSLGHGVGLEVHEAPYLRPPAPSNQQTTSPADGSTTNNQRLTSNMVFSVEPGLYFPWGGVRIEDLVVIQNGKAKVLGRLLDELIELDI